MRWRGLWRTVKGALLAWSGDKASSMGAALAYYTLFSIVPMLLVLIALAGLVFGPDAARGEIVEQLSGVLGRASAQMIDDMLRLAHRPEHGLAATIVSFATLLIGATTVLAELQTDLDRIFRTPPAVRRHGLWGLLRGRILSLGMILGLGFVIVISLALSAALAAFGRWWTGFMKDFVILLQVVNFVFDVTIIAVVIAMIYKFMPSVHLRWHDVWRGAVLTSLLLAVGKFLIGFYIGRSDVASGFGAAGSLIILLIWVYYSAQIFLLGAEFTAVLARGHGEPAHRRHPATHAGGPRSARGQL
jgi:membrane protein